MAEFDIAANITDRKGERVRWLALPDSGESPEQVVSQVKQAAIDRFGSLVYFNRWDHVVASNGFFTVCMHTG